jgi:hypothetical protein
MADDFELILDECIDRINRGDSLADCLSDYPIYAERLRPLLESMSSLQMTYAFVPSPGAKRTARQKFNTALEKRRRAPLSAFFGFLSRPAVWAPIAVIVLAIVGLWWTRAVQSPPQLVSSPGGNFAFFISDEPNDIGDFESLNITISKVGLQSAGSGKWVEFTPDVNTIDLTQFQGDLSQEIWRGEAPVGSYSQIFILVSSVEGSLKTTGKSIAVKLPGGKLHLSLQFEITSDTVTSFTFDITVIKTGNNGKYILKPQVGESGILQEPRPSEQKAGQGKGKSNK